MAYNFFKSSSTVAQQRLLNHMRNMLVGVEGFGRERNAMVEMIDGGTDYTLIQELYGFESGRADEAFAEIDSLYGRLFTNASVSDCLAARNQCLSRFGVT